MDLKEVVFVYCVFASLLVSTGSKTQQQIDKVHVVFMNHLDVGFKIGNTPTVGYVGNVLNAYFSVYFPRAIQIVQDLAKHGHNETFIYTTHPWLVYLYLQCDTIYHVIGGRPIYCPTNESKALFEEYIRKGNIAWHAGAMNMQYEYLTELGVRLSLNVSQDLDRQFDINRQFAVMSQRDVPGMSQAVVPVLSDMGVAGISVGMDAASASPDIPPVFVWKFKGKKVIALWHKGGYPNPPGPNPSDPGGLSRDDCVIVEGLTEALCFAFRADNVGPPVNYTMVLKDYGILRSEFPNAEVTASTFDQFMESLTPMGKHLPVRDCEIGDTWIQGTGSDPLKSAKFRVFSRELEDCYQSGACNGDDPRIKHAANWLIKCGEHTWGLTKMKDNTNWTNEACAKAINTSDFFNHTNSWVEQREFLDLALDALQGHPLGKKIVKKYHELVPREPDLSSYVDVSDPSSAISCGDGTILQFGDDGSLVQLYDPYNQVDWAGPSNPMGQFIYHSYNASDDLNFALQYCYKPDCNITGLTKRNLTANANVESKQWNYTMTKLFRKKNATSYCDIQIQLTPIDPRVFTYYGGPRQLWLQYVSKIGPKHTPGIEVTVQLFNKTTTRLTESLSYYFKPLKPSNQTWRISKIGKPVDPLNVVLNGSQYVQATDSGVHYLNTSGSGLRLLTPDVPLVLWSTPSHPPSVYPVPLKPISDGITGAAFNIYNNAWNINWVLWYPYRAEDKNIKSRFKIAFVKNDKN